MTETAVLVPSPGRPRPLTAPRVADEKVSGGLRVLAVRKATVPRVEMRLFMPAGGRRNVAADRVLGETITSGTSRRSAHQIAQELQRLGGSLAAGLNADHVHFGGSVLSMHLGRYLDLLAEVLTDAAFPTDEIVVARGRVAQTVAIQRSQPEVVAQEALQRRLFGTHPYGHGLPTPDAVEKASRASLVRRYADVAVPRDAVLVLVGDLTPARAIDLVGNALSRWKGRRTTTEQRPKPIASPKRMLVVDRPGALQTNMRVAGAIPPPDAPEAALVEVTNTIFGGYFISRFVENLRERNGYTYSPRSVLVHRKLASYLQIVGDVGTEVTAPSLNETRYELGRMVAAAVDENELISAQRYLNGILSIRTQSQAGLAGTLAGLVLHGLGVDELRDYPKRVAAVTVDDVREAARKYFAPNHLTYVLVGDASRIASDLEPFGDVEVTTA